MRAATGAGHRRIGIGADHRQRAQPGRIQRQGGAVVLQQHYAFARGFQRGGAPALAVARQAQILLLAIEEAEADGRTQDAAHLVVQRRGAQLPAVQGGEQRGGTHRLALGHLQVQAGVGGLDAVVGRLPVRHENAVETPFALEDVGTEMMALGGVVAIDQVVAAHHRAAVRLLHRRLEGRQIQLAQGALVDDGVEVAAVVFRVVGGEVLDRGDHAPALQALDEADHGARGQVGVLAVVLHVASVHRRPVQVHPRPEQEMDAARPRIVAERSAGALRQRGVPGGRKGDAGRIGGAGTVDAHTHRPVRHLQLGQIDFRYRPHVEAFTAADQIDLLRSAQFRQQAVYALLDRRTIRRWRLCAQQPRQQRCHQSHCEPQSLHRCSSLVLSISRRQA